MWESLEIEPPEGLYHRILARIARARLRAARIRLGFLSMTIVGSLAALIPALQYTLQEFTQSGFYQYLSLVLSDGGTLFAHWHEYILTLAESLPLAGITLMLSGIFVLFGSLKLAIKYYELQRFYSIKYF
ncbi:MAG: hypothetical protein AAB482_01315 [Patescibacteria group bacterium]